MPIDQLDDNATISSLARIVGISREAMNKHKYLPDTGTNRDWIKVYCERQRELAAGRGGEEQYELTAERARLAHHQANKTALEEEELRGALVRTEYVSGLWATLANNVKNKMRGIPHKAAPSLDAAEDYQEILEILTKYIDEALTDLADGELLTETNRVDEAEAKPAAKANSQ